MKHLILSDNSTNNFFNLDYLVSASLIRKHLSLDDPKDLYICAIYDEAYLDEVMSKAKHVHLLESHTLFTEEAFRKYKKQRKQFSVYTSTCTCLDYVEKSLSESSEDDNIYIETDYFSLSNAIYDMYFTRQGSYLLQVIDHIRKVDFSNQDKVITKIVTGILESIHRIQNLQQPLQVTTNLKCSLIDSLLYMNRKELETYAQDLLAQELVYAPGRGATYVTFEA